jgi:hypothetical protein
MAEIGRGDSGSFTGATLAQQWPGDAAATVAQALYFPASGPATDALAVSDLTAPAPLIEAVALGQTHALAVSDIVAPVPIIEGVALSQTQALAVGDLVAPAPEIEAPALTESAPPVADQQGGGRGRVRVVARRVFRLAVGDLRAPAPVLERPALWVTPSDAQIRAELRRRHEARLRADDEDAIAALLAA